MGDENSSSVLGQDDINKLLNGKSDTDESAGDGNSHPLQPTGEPDVPANETGEDGTLSQEDLDRLMSEAIEASALEDAESSESAPSEAETPADVGDGETAESAGTLSQEDLDRLMSEAVEAPEAGETEPPEHHGPVDPDPATSSGEGAADISETVEIPPGDNEPDAAEPSDPAAPAPSDTEPMLAVDKGENADVNREDEDMADNGDENEEISFLSDEDLDELMLEEVETPIAAEQDTSDDHDAPAPKENNSFDIKATTDPDPEEPAKTKSDTVGELKPLDSEDLKTDGRLTPMVEITAKKPGRFRLIYVTTALVFALTCIGGWVALRPDSAIRERLFPKATDEKKTTSPLPLPQETPVPTVPPEKTERLQPEVSPRTDIFGNLPEVFRDSIEYADRVRQTLLSKQQELENLQRYYRRGIDQIKESLLYDVPGSEKISYEVVSQNKKMMLGLRTIQRRRAYISHLNTMSMELQSASEELLYLKRQTAINAIVGPVTSGLDNRSLAAYIRSVSQVHATDLENKVFDVMPEGVEPLSEIWSDIQAGGRKKKAVLDKAPPPSTGVKKKNPAVEAERNGKLSKEICSGDLSRKYMLRRLTEKTAQCLAEWPGKDLVLNGLTEMTPGAAKRLSQWQGDWLCLNGFSELSSKAAEHLFRWKGKRLSLNGLSMLSPGVSGYIAGWPGKQLELTGLTDLPFEVASNLIKWQEKGGTIYVPEKFRGKSP